MCVGKTDDGLFDLVLPLDEEAKAVSKQFQTIVTSAPTLMLPAVPIETFKEFGLYASSDKLLQDGDDPTNDLDFDSGKNEAELKPSSAASSSVVTPSGRTWIPRSAKLAAYFNFLSSRRMGWSAELFNVLHHGDAQEQEPANFKEACSDNRWVKSMEKEYQSLIQNTTWKLVPRQTWMNVITSKCLQSGIFSRLDVKTRSSLRTCICVS
jgi:hypothetical protein